MRDCSRHLRKSAGNITRQTWCQPAGGQVPIWMVQPMNSSPFAVSSPSLGSWRRPGLREVFVRCLGLSGLSETTCAVDFPNLTPFLGGPFQRCFPIDLARCLLLPVSCSLLFPAHLRLLGGQRSYRGGKEPGTVAWVPRSWAVPAPRPSLTARGLPLACLLSACPPCPVAWHAEGSPGSPVCA